MRVRGLIALLQKENADAEVMIERGEWGPSRISGVRAALVRDSGGRVECWEIYFPQVPDDADDNPRAAVVLID